MILAQQGLTSPELQYGAFGLCLAILGFCALLWRSNRQERAELSKIIAGKDVELSAMAREKERRILEVTDAHAALVRLNTAAINQLTQALRYRKCLAGDRALESGPLAGEMEQET